MKIVILSFLAALAIHAQPVFTNLGAVRFDNGLTWANPNIVPIAGYRIYIGPTNFQPGFTNNYLALTNFTPVPGPYIFQTNSWAGSNSISLSGQRALFITAISTNLMDESDRSDIVLVNFRAGIPLPPKNIQLYSILTMAATNSLLPIIPQ